MKSELPCVTKKTEEAEQMVEQRELDSLLSSIARGEGSAVDSRDPARVGTDTAPRQVRRKRLIASYHERPDLKARLESIELRLAYVRVSRTYIKTSRDYIELRLQEAYEDVAYAGDTALAFEEVRSLYADHTYSGSSGNSGLLAWVDAALGGIRPRLSEIETLLAKIRCGVAYTRAEESLSQIGIELADIEAGLVRIGARIAYADDLLSEVGLGTEGPTLVRIPLPLAQSLSGMELER